jgi:hypothetical protein
VTADEQFRRVVWAAVAGQAASLAEALDATATVPCDSREFRAVDDALSQLDGQIRAFRSSLALRLVAARLGTVPALK